MTDEKSRGRRKRVSSHPEVLLKRAEDAFQAQEELEVEPEEVDALMEGITQKMRVIASKAQADLARSTERLNGITFRPPAPGPVEKLG